MQGEELDIVERLAQKVKRHEEVRLASAPHSTATGAEEKLLSDALQEIVNLRGSASGRGITERWADLPLYPMEGTPIIDALLANEVNGSWVREHQARNIERALHHCERALQSAGSEAQATEDWSFRLDAAQEAKLQAWRAEQDKAALEKQRAAATGDPFIAAVHEAGSPYYGAIGGEITFSFIPTSIGTVVKAKHSSGAEIDLTDYDAW